MTDDLKRAAVFAGVTTVCLFGLAACGGGNAVGEPTESQREDRLASSWPGMLSFALAQIARPDADRAEPRAIDGIAPPLSEDAEPAAI
jgi:hypothetical protein